MAQISMDNKLPTERKCDVEAYEEECSICESTHQEPKTLKCLHSFCLKCLVEKVAGENEITCPTCDKVTSLPSQGIEGLNTNFLLIKRHERRLLYKQLKEKDSFIPCTSCENDTENKAAAWCRQCQDYMCETAIKYHNGRRITKGHEVISLEQLRSEGIPKSRGDAAGEKVRMCPKHTDEKLKFYCETCEVPFCRDCEIIEHPRGDNHVQLYLEDAIRKRSGEIQKKADECKYVCQQIDNVIAEDEKVEAAHETACKAAQKAYDDAAKQVQDAFSEIQIKHRDHFASELARFDEKRKQKLESHKENLKKDQSRASSALAVARMLAETGTQCDVADMYNDVMTVLREFSEFKPVPERMSEVAFDPSEECLPLVEGIPAPGTLKVGSCEWDLKREFGNGNLSAARGITFAPHDNLSDHIVVADYSARNVKLFDNAGTLSKTVSQGTASFLYPFDVCLSSDNFYYISDVSSTVRQITGNFKYNSYGSVSSAAYGIAPLKKGSWPICCTSTDNNRIYLYSNNTKIGDIHVVSPQFIAVTSTDNYVVSSTTQKSVQVLNEKGHMVRCIGPPSDIPDDAWSPSGVCCSKNDEIYVANQGEGAMGVYRFKISGEFIECVASDLNKPWGVALSEDDRELAVVDNDGKSVKLFGYKY